MFTVVSCTMLILFS